MTRAKTRKFLTGLVFLFIRMVVFTIMLKTSHRDFRDFSLGSSKNHFTSGIKNAGFIRFQNCLNIPPLVGHLMEMLKSVIENIIQCSSDATSVVHVKTSSLFVISRSMCYV